MKQREDKQTGDLLVSANARRQAAFRARWIKAGWQRKNLWVHTASYEAGKLAGDRGQPLNGWLEAHHGTSWLLGYAAGLETQES